MGLSKRPPYSVLMNLAFVLAHLSFLTKASEVPELKDLKYLNAQNSIDSHTLDGNPLAGLIDDSTNVASPREPEPQYHEEDQLHSGDAQTREPTTTSSTGETASGSLATENEPPVGVSASFTPQMYTIPWTTGYWPTVSGYDMIQPGYRWSYPALEHQFLTPYHWPATLPTQHVALVPIYQVGTIAIDPFQSFYTAPQATHYPGLFQTGHLAPTIRHDAYSHAPFGLRESGHLGSDHLATSIPPVSTHSSSVPPTQYNPDWGHAQTNTQPSFKHESFEDEVVRKSLDPHAPSFVPNLEETPSTPDQETTR